VSFHVFVCFVCYGAFVSYVHLDVDYTGAHGDDDDGDDGLRQMVHGQTATEIVDGDDDKIIQCLKHVRAPFIFPSFAFLFV
jgi:hypothetical protein